MKWFDKLIKRAKEGPEKTPVTVTPQKRQNNAIAVKSRSYDIAATTRHNENHWKYATSGDADSFIFPALQTTRNRARYEIANNSYAKGAVDTRANDLVGTGPRLQVASPDNIDANEIENAFHEWAQDCDAAGKLSLTEVIRLACSLQQDESGEGIIVFQNEKQKQNWMTYKSQVTFKLSVIEPDRLTSPTGLAASFFDDKVKEGVEFNENGKPAYYYILDKHPGSVFNSSYGDYAKISAEQVIHYYSQDRPGQTRGFPRIAPALSLFTQLRSYTESVVKAAQQASNISGFLKPDQAPAEDDAPVVLGEELEIPMNSLLTYPGEMSQIKAEQPTGTYKDFKREILNEIGRCLGLPFNIIAANSSEYNYASGRLDWQIYFRGIKTERRHIEQVALNRIFYTWLREAILAGILKTHIKNITEIKTSWFWPGAEHVDPVKEATAQKILFGNLATTLADEDAKAGVDWERRARQQAKEIALLKELGLPNPYDQGGSKMGTPKDNTGTNNNTSNGNNGSNGGKDKGARADLASMFDKRSQILSENGD